jgi:hypothetical protein
MFDAGRCARAAPELHRTRGSGAVLGSHLGGLQAIAHRQRSAGKDRPGRPACVIDGLEIIILFI